MDLYTFQIRIFVDAFHGVFQVKCFYCSGFLDDRRHLYCYIHNISTDISSGLQVFIKLRSLHGTLNQVLYLIHGVHLF